MLKIMKIGCRESGDTIVEVMIVLAILGLATGIAFATANKSLLDTSQAEENSQASDYVQAEVEDIRYLSPTSTNNPSDPTYGDNGNIFRPSAAFCIQNPTAGSPILVGNASNCAFGSTGQYVIYAYDCDHFLTAPCDAISIPPNSDSFVIVATWPDIGGDGNDTVTMTYRVHAP